MSNEAQNVTEPVEEGATAVLEIPFADQNGEDLGSFYVDPDQKVSEMIQEIVQESGLPLQCHMCNEQYFVNAEQIGELMNKLDART